MAWSRLTKKTLKRIKIATGIPSAMFLFGTAISAFYWESWLLLLPACIGYLLACFTVAAHLRVIDLEEKEVAVRHGERSSSLARDQSRDTETLRHNRAVEGLRSTEVSNRLDTATGKLDAAAIVETKKLLDEKTEVNSQLADLEAKLSRAGSNPARATQIQKKIDQLNDHLDDLTTLIGAASGKTTLRGSAGGGKASKGGTPVSLKSAQVRGGARPGEIDYAAIEANQKKGTEPYVGSARMYVQAIDNAPDLMKAREIGQKALDAGAMSDPEARAAILSALSAKKSQNTFWPMGGRPEE